MSIAFFCENLKAFEASRAKRLHSQLLAQGLGGIEAVYALVWPNYEPPFPSRPQDNRSLFRAWRAAAELPLWAWFNAQADQVADANQIATLDAQLEPNGWKLDIEGNWVKGAKLGVLIGGAKRTGKPIGASLAGTSSSHVEYDYRCFDANDVHVDWQSYEDSQEGPDPASAVRELYRPSFVIEGWEYRHHLAGKYGWGQIARRAGSRGFYNSYKRPGTEDGHFAVSDRVWGMNVVDPTLYRSGQKVGMLMGRARYPLIRVTLDTTRGFNDKIPLEEWEQRAASARVPGSAKRQPVGIYLAENTSDAVVMAIARGAA